MVLQAWIRPGLHVKGVFYPAPPFEDACQYPPQPHLSGSLLPSNRFLTARVATPVSSSQEDFFFVFSLTMDFEDRPPVRP